LAAVLSCRTPPPAVLLKHPTEALPSGKELYFSFSVGPNRGFLRRVLRDNGFPSRGSEYLIENSRFFYGAADFHPGSAPVFSLIAEGVYSGSLIEFGIGREAGWEKIEKTFGTVRARYYREKDGPGQIAAPSDTMVVLSTGDIEECLSRLYTPHRSPLPSEILSRFEANEAAAYLPAPAPEGIIGGLSGALGLPAVWESLVVSAEGRDGSRYAFTGNLILTPGRDGRAPAVLLRLFLSGWLAARGRILAEIRSTLRVESRENIITFSGVVLSEDETAELIQSIIKISGGGKKP
jgi:hypothetical protein